MKRKIKTALQITIIILVAIGCIFALGQCSNSRKAKKEEAKNEAIIELQNQILQLSQENAELKNHVNDLAYAVSPTYDIPSAESAPEATSVQTVTAPQQQQEASNKVCISAVDVSIPQISKESEKPKVTLVYCGQTFDVTAYTEDNLERIKDRELPYYGSVERNASAVISGITINGVYKIDGGTWKAVEGIQFDYVDNTYICPLYVEGTERNIYMVQTVNGSHFYFAVRSRY